jgi:hypothetical protein
MGRVKTIQERQRKMREKQTFIMANLVYGQCYPDLWLENQLKSLLDASNLPALKDAYKLEYAIFTDDPTLLKISRHPNFMQLSAVCELHIIKMNWPPDADQFNSRYGLLLQMIQQMLDVALQPQREHPAWLGVWVADLVFAKHSLPTMLKQLEQGHDAVFNVPIRGAADSINQVLAQLPGAPSDMELFNLAYHNLHHLWVASHWDASMFSKFPYSMVWNSGSGLVTHNFGITPIVFKPTAEMKDVKGGLDSGLPGYFKNPYWATDWLDAAVAGVEPLSNGHYPPFLHHKASEEFVCTWSKSGTQLCQAAFLDKPLYYPNKKIFNNQFLADQAQKIAESIQRQLTEPAASVEQRAEGRQSW